MVQEETMLYASFIHTILSREQTFRYLFKQIKNEQNEDKQHFYHLTHLTRAGEEQ